MIFETVWHQQWNTVGYNQPIVATGAANAWDELG